MEQITLTAQPRTVTGKQVRQLRRQGLIPAVVYGHRTEPTPLTIEERELRQVLQRAGGNQLIRLQVGDDQTTRMVLLREVQRDPIKRRLLHVDLYEVVMTERIRAEIPVAFTGASPAVQRGEGLLHHGIEAIEVECLPGDLLPHIEVSLDQLTEVDQEIRVGDLSLGERIEVLSDPDELLVRVIPVETEEAVEEVAPEAESQVEIIKREKPEKAEEE
ncbi:MAG: 50S ribosomal protein L25 [Anaerolineae bacterium]|nr:50S ribosomal protein L25 [Anaerolineae bacterium]